MNIHYILQFAPVRPFQVPTQSNIWGKTGAYQNDSPFRCFTLGQALCAFSQTLDNSVKACQGQTLQLLPPLVNYDCRNSYNILLINTFYTRKLKPFQRCHCKQNSLLISYHTLLCYYSQFEIRSFCINEQRSILNTEVSLNHKTALMIVAFLMFCLPFQSCPLQAYSCTILKYSYCTN